jgi:two-component system OmpR family sensor kinase
MHIAMLTVIRRGWYTMSVLSSILQTDIYRLTQMNRRLTLLTKIENKQFTNPEGLSLNRVVKKRIENFNELFPNKITYSATAELEVKMDSYLADVLVDNLLSNALKHSEKGYSPCVEIMEKSISISNRGASRLQNPERLFSRFYRESNLSKSTGLGLSIAKKIAELYGFRIGYDFEDRLHIFTITINN